MGVREFVALGLAASIAVAATGVRADWRGDPTPIDERRQAALEAIDARHRTAGEDPSAPTPNLTLRYSYHEYYYQDKVAAIFGLVDMGAASEDRLEEANRLLRWEMLGNPDWAITSPGQLGDDSRRWMHRSRTLGMRLYALYRHWMDDDIVAEYEKRLGWMIRPPQTSSSENIKLTNTSAYYLSHELLGRTGEDTYAQNRDFLLDMLRRFGNDGFHEWGGSYGSWTFIAVLNLAEFAEDDEVRTLARMVIDHALARQLSQSLGSFFESAKVRAYSHWSIGGWVSPNTRLAQLLFGGDAGDRVWSDFAVSNYAPLSLHRSIYDDARPYAGRAADSTGGGQRWRHYWRRGRSFLMSAHRTPEPDGYVLPSGGTHDIIQATVVASSGPTHRVTAYPYDTRTGFSKKRNLAQRSFAHDNVMLVQNSGTTRAVWAGGAAATGIPARLFHSPEWNVEIDSGWAFLRRGDTYVAWAPTIGAPRRDPESADLIDPEQGAFLKSDHVPGDDGEPVVIEVGDRASFGDWPSFKSAILTRNGRPRRTDGVVEYETRDGTVLRWFPARVTVDGADYDPSTHPRLDTPWVGPSSIEAGGARLDFDFAAPSTSGADGRVDTNMVFGEPPVDPPDPSSGPPVYGFVYGQEDNRIAGWAYDHESDTTELEIEVLSSPVHSEPTVVGRIAADQMAGAEQDMNIRSFVVDRIGEEPPDGYRFIWGGDFESFLAGFGLLEPGTYELRVRALDKQNPDGGSRVLATYPDGIDTFEIEVTGEATPPDGGIVPSDGGVSGSDAATGADGGSDSGGGGGGGCGCATAPSRDGSGASGAALVVLIVLAGLRRRLTAP